MNTKISGAVNDKILSTVKNKLHPKISLLLVKLLLIHTSTALITLSLCPQFGFKLFKLPINLMYSFMILGMPVCNFLCGLFFTTTSMIVASIILERDELRALKFKKTLAAGSLLLASIGFFSIMNPQLFVEFSILWLIGAFSGIVLTLEVSSRVLARELS